MLGLSSIDHSTSVVELTKLRLVKVYRPIMTISYKIGFTFIRNVTFST